MRTVKDAIEKNSWSQIDQIDRLLSQELSSTQPQDLIVGQLAAIQELIASVSQSQSLRQGCQKLTKLMASHLGCHVSVGIRYRPKENCKVLATSDSLNIDRNEDSIQLASFAMEEAIARGNPSHWPCENSHKNHSLRAIRQFAESPAIQKKHQAISIFPFQSEQGQTQGALILRFDSLPNISEQKNADRFVDAMSPLLASSIALHLRAEGNRIDRLCRSASDFLRSQKAKVALIVSALTLLIMLVPIPYKVGCQCELQPVVRRYVAAPFSGRLENSSFLPGETVKKGDTLARMDARDVNWDLAGKLAELKRATSVRDGHLALHESGEAQIATLEVERLKLAVEQLRFRASKVEIKSPIDGMVVFGDLSKSEGVVLETGQRLYEIAPLDHMIVEVAIPESDVRFVEPEMLVSITLDAFPNKTINARVDRVHPRAELKDHENVFIAEIRIPNAEQSYRPGMRGRARITTAGKPIGWIFLHKAYESLRNIIF